MGPVFFLVLIPRKSRKGTIPAPVDWNGKIAMTQQRNRKRSLAVAVVLILFNMKYSVVLMMKETFYIMNVVLQILTFYFVTHGIRSTVRVLVVRYMVCIHRLGHMLAMQCVCFVCKNNIATLHFVLQFAFCKQPFPWHLMPYSILTCLDICVMRDTTVYHTTRVCRRMLHFLFYASKLFPAAIFSDRPAGHAPSRRNRRDGGPRARCGFAPGEVVAEAEK